MASDGLRTAGFYSLFARFNKKKGQQDEVEDGLIESLGELTLEKPDDELLELIRSWNTLYDGSMVKARIHVDGDICERYWVGRQYPDTEYENGRRPLTDNVIFPNFETLIANATQQNPEPIVLTNDEAKQVGEKIHMSLEYLARECNLKDKLKDGTRFWGIRFLGAWQTLWDAEEEEITVRSLNPKDLILDPNAYIEEGEYHGEFIGIKLTDTAQNLITRFPDKEADIKKACNNKLGSLMGYTQWRTDEFVVYSMQNIVLLKHKNENWNYDQTTLSIDETGQPVPSVQKGKNHWSRPKLAMKFLVTYDMGDEPADKTSLIFQAIPTQDNINKGLRQYDRNVDNINGGVVVNGLMFNKEQSAQVGQARREGRTIVSPGKPEDAIMFPNQAEVPASLMERINDDRMQIAVRMGVAGSTPDSTEQEKTVRGKIIAGNQDATRTGSAITSPLEIVAAGIYNDMLQLIYVFWDEPHTVAVLGPQNAQTMLQFKASEIPESAKIQVLVQDGSLIPQDELSQYNTAMAEWENGISDPLSYYEAVKDPNPLERAQKLMTFKTNPAQYMAQYLQQQAPVAPPLPQGGGGSESGQPPAAVSPPPAVPSPVQAESSQIIKSVPIQKI